MATEAAFRERIEELESRIAELAAQLREVTEERDDALREVARLRGDDPLAVRASEPIAAVEPLGPVACTFCDGEGVYWVHDFEMACKRCNGTGYSDRATSDATAERH